MRERGCVAISTNKHHLNSHSDKHTLEAAASLLRRRARRPRANIAFGLRAQDLHCERGTDG